MEEEHAAELEMIESGALPPEPHPAEVRRRARVYLPVAGVLALALAGMTYYFLTFETSAITTIPPISDGPVFVRATPTQAPVTAVPESAGGALVWAGGIGPMLQAKCASCHGSTGGYSVETYAAAMEAITAGEPENSSVVELMQAGGHPGMLSDAELQQLIEWIDDGAPEGAEGAAANAPTTWEGGVGALFEATCASCHGSMGGFSAETYDGVLEAVKPGDPDGSQVVELMRAGGHPGMFGENERNIVINWIQAGAPQQ
jgi:mono/diheme cytochrome c family protein